MFPDDSSKINFVIGYLREDAYRWIEPHLELRSNLYFQDFATFIAALLAAKGDPDAINTYTRKLEALKQTGSASTYTTEFYRLAAYLTWNDSALLAQYKRGLKPEIKDALALREVDSTTTQHLAEVAIKFDNRLFERKEERKNEGRPSTTPSNQSKPSSNFDRSSTRPSTAMTASKTTTTTTSGPMAMDLDTARFKKHKALTPQEREYRLSNNLCLYCGEAGHRAGACPKKTAVRLHATIEATPSKQLASIEAAKSLN